VKKEYADLLRRADAIFIEELRATPYVPVEGRAVGAAGMPKNWYEATSQAFTGRRVARHPRIRAGNRAARALRGRWTRFMGYLPEL
jgi:GMP synthase PP-ATPase subunit